MRAGILFGVRRHSEAAAALSAFRKPIQVRVPSLSESASTLRFAGALQRPISLPQVVGAERKEESRRAGSIRSRWEYRYGR